MSSPGSPSRKRVGSRCAGQGAGGPGPFPVAVEPRHTEPEAVLGADRRPAQATWLHPQAHDVLTGPVAPAPTPTPRPRTEPPPRSAPRSGSDGCRPADLNSTLRTGPGASRPLDGPSSARPPRTAVAGASRPAAPARGRCPPPARLPGQRPPRPSLANRLARSPSGPIEPRSRALVIPPLLMGAGNVGQPPSSRVRRLAYQFVSCRRGALAASCQWHPNVQHFPPPLIR
jgi:hypothetical protein